MFPEKKIEHVDVLKNKHGRANKYDKSKTTVSWKSAAFFN